MPAIRPFARSELNSRPRLFLPACSDYNQYTYPGVPGMAVSVEQFVENLVRSGLFTAAELAAFQEGLAPERRAKDVQGFARELVQAGRLTKYQAAEIYQGKTKGLVLGDYVVLDEIGAGGMGQVFKAWHRTMERTVALKKLPQRTMRSPQAVDRFRREVKAAARLEHPNIVTAYDAGEAEGIHFLVMQYVDGRDLADVLAERGPLPVADAVDYMIQAARGLEYAHRQGIVHRDIKPANLLLDREGTVKILDMGLARMHQPDRPMETARSERLTESGQVMGTFDYMAPEQAQDTHHADHRADVYSLGCTLYRLLTGDPPYQGHTPVQILFAHSQAAIPSLCEARPDVPARLDAACQKMMAKRPEDRQPSMAAVVADLEACVVPQAPPVQGPVPPPAPQPPPEPPPVAAKKSSSTDSKLRAFLRNLAPASVATRRKAARATDETVGPQTEHETRMLDRRELTAAPRSRKTLVLVSIAGAAAALVVILGLLLAFGPRGHKAKEATRTGHVPSSSQTDAAQPPEQAAKKSPVPFSEPEWQPAWAETDAKAKALIAEQRFGEAEALYHELNERFEHVELNRKVADAIASIREQATTALQKIEAQARQLSIEHKFADARAVLRPAIEKHAIPANAEAAQKLLAEIDAAEAEAKVETARREAMETQQEIERRYAEAMKPVEDLVAAWDFQGSSAALAKVQFEEKELAARLTAWRSGVDRLVDLKARILRNINTADPRFKKSDLQIRGAGGEIVQADEQGIQTKLSTGKTESLPWPDVGPQAIEKLIGLVSTPDTPDDRLAAGVLCLASKDPTSAERHFDKARALGADVGPYLAPLAATAFAKAEDLVEAEKFSEAESLLANVEAKYTDTPWFASNRAAFEAARAKAQAGIYEAEAEKLYAEAAELFKKEQLFDVKPLVAKLRTEYGNAQAATNTTRKPSFAEMEKAVADLGRFITVRQEGKGEFTSIQAAIDAAPPHSLIEIQDNGPYNEKIRTSTDGLTIRGKTGFWPIITSSGPLSSFPVLVEFSGTRMTIERLLLLHGGAAGSQNCCIAAPNALVSARLCLIWGGGTMSRYRAFNAEACAIFAPLSGRFTARDSPNISTNGFDQIELENCVMESGNFGEYALRDARLRSCVIAQPVIIHSPEVNLVDCILPSVESVQLYRAVEYCNVHGNPPFIDQAKPGKGCLTAPPGFVDPANLDYRLLPTSPCIGKASDGGDIGCRYTPGMIEMVQKALELRAKGIIKF